MSIRLRAKAYVLDVQDEKAFESEVTRRVMIAFQKHRVLPPAVLHRSVDRSPVTQQPTTSALQSSQKRSPLW